MMIFELDLQVWLCMGCSKQFFGKRIRWVGWNKWYTRGDYSILIPNIPALHYCKWGEIGSLKDYTRSDRLTCRHHWRRYSSLTRCRGPTPPDRAKLYIYLKVLISDRHAEDKWRRINEKASKSGVEVRRCGYVLINSAPGILIYSLPP